MNTSQVFIVISNI